MGFDDNGLGWTIGGRQPGNGASILYAIKSDAKVADNNAAI
jgi:hypothetical protein